MRKKKEELDKQYGLAFALGSICYLIALKFINGVLLELSFGLIARIITHILLFFMVVGMFNHGFNTRATQKAIMRH